MRGKSDKPGEVLKGWEEYSWLLNKKWAKELNRGPAQQWSAHHILIMDLSNSQIVHQAVISFANWSKLPVPNISSYIGGEMEVF